MSRNDQVAEHCQQTTEQVLAEEYAANALSRSLQVIVYCQQIRVTDKSRRLSNKHSVTQFCRLLRIFNKRD